MHNYGRGLKPPDTEVKKKDAHLIIILMSDAFGQI